LIIRGPGLGAFSGKDPTKVDRGFYPTARAPSLAVLRASSHHPQEKKPARRRTEARRRWIREQGLLDPARLVFVDETGVNTHMVRLSG
jgi:hypothetical protein